MYTRLCIIMFVESSAVNNNDVVWPQIFNVLTSHRRKIIIVD